MFFFTYSSYSCAGLLAKWAFIYLFIFLKRPVFKTSHNHFFKSLIRKTNQIKKNDTLFFQVICCIHSKCILTRKLIMFFLCNQYINSKMVLLNLSSLLKIKSDEYTSEYRFENKGVPIRRRKKQSVDELRIVNLVVAVRRLCGPW